MSRSPSKESFKVRVLGGVEVSVSTSVLSKVQSMKIREDEEELVYFYTKSKLRKYRILYVVYIKVKEDKYICNEFEGERDNTAYNCAIWYKG